MFEVKHPITRKEDFFINMTIVAEGISQDFRCKVYLPHRQTDQVWLYFYPIAEQTFILKNFAHLFWKFAVRGELRGLNGKTTQISADNVYSFKITMQTWGTELQECLFKDGFINH